VRLDHLLSTENSGRRSAGRCRLGGPDSPVVLGAAGVEMLSLAVWYGYAFGLPDRHPRLGAGAIRRPVRAGRALSGVVRAWCVVV
jgi:hypothetical protein